ncbi:MAG: Gfo/Idh/MocA family oxidoreductase [SAR324 cluster bacterium]|nr:Gfo/Idh/MocA family oxidoreductase [SAR324 cluster bacterium]
MPKSLRYGFLGCGMMGKEHIRNLSMVAGAKVNVIFEPNKKMRSEISRVLPQARFVETEEELIRAKDVDALVITSPNYLHTRQLEYISEIRPLPVLVEKPICTSLEQIRTLKKLDKQYPAPIWVAMEYRYMPPVSRLVEEVHSGKTLGKITSLSIREHRYPFLKKVDDWNRFNENTGGTLVEKCCHFFDLMCFILQSEPKKIYCSGAQDVNHLDEIYNGRVPDILDNAFVIVDFSSGQRAMLELNMFADGSRFQESIVVVGSKAKVECKIPGPTRFWPKDSLGESPVPILTLSPRKPKDPKTLEIPIDTKLLEAGDHNGSTFYQHERFARVLRGEQKVEVTLQDGINAVLMGLAAQHSIETGEAINLMKGDYRIYRF